jgi:hypothetical protein
LQTPFQTIQKAADMMSDIDNAIEISDEKNRLQAIEKIKDKIKKIEIIGDVNDNFNIQLFSELFYKRLCIAFIDYCNAGC